MHHYLVIICTVEIKNYDPKIYTLSSYYNYNYKMIGIIGPSIVFWTQLYRYIQ